MQAKTRSTLRFFFTTAALALLTLITPQRAFALRDALVEITVPTTVECVIQPDGTVIAPSRWSITSSNMSVDCDITSVATHNALPDFDYRLVDNATDDLLNLFTDGVDKGGGQAYLKSGASHTFEWIVRPLTAAKGSKIAANAVAGAVKLADVSFTIKPRKLTGNIELKGTPFNGETISFEYSGFPSTVQTAYWRFTYPDGRVEEKYDDYLHLSKRTLKITEEMCGAQIDVLVYHKDKRFYGTVASNRLAPVTAGYAVFCEDDGSLEFFQNNLGLPKVGELSKTGKRVTAVYPGVNHKEPSGNNTRRLWYDLGERVKSARVVDHVFSDYFDGWFYDMKNCTTIDIRNLDASKSTSVALSFKNCRALTEILGIETLDVSNATNFEGMFMHCKSLTTLDLSSWDTHNAIWSAFMFNGCSNLTKLDVSQFDTSNIRNFYQMFYDCDRITSLDLNAWDVSSVEDFRYVFWGMDAIEHLHVSSWDVSKITDFTGAFENCHRLKDVEVADWDMSSAVSIKDMFNNCYATHIPVESWDTSSLEIADQAFCQCLDLINLDLSGWDTSKLKSAEGMFYRCLDIESVGMDGWDTSSLQNVDQMFAYCPKLSADLSTWDVSSVISRENFSPGCKQVILPLAWQ